LFLKFSLKYLNENRYEVEGFTSVDKATHDDTEVLVLPNSGRTKCFVLYTINIRMSR